MAALLVAGLLLACDAPVCESMPYQICNDTRQCEPHSSFDLLETVISEPTKYHNGLCFRIKFVEWKSDEVVKCCFTLKADPQFTWLFDSNATVFFNYIDRKHYDRSGKSYTIFMSKEIMTGISFEMSGTLTLAIPPDAKLIWLTFGTRSLSNRLDIDEGERCRKRPRK